MEDYRAKGDAHYKLMTLDADEFIAECDAVHTAVSNTGVTYQRTRRLSAGATTRR